MVKKKEDSARILFWEWESIYFTHLIDSKDSVIMY